MPPIKKTIATPLGEKEVTVVHINGSQETANTYSLDDGTVLTLKTVVVEVVRSDADFDPEGNPAYFLKSAQIVVANSPASLKQKKGN